MRHRPGCDGAHLAWLCGEGEAREGDRAVDGDASNAG